MNIRTVQENERDLVRAQRVAAYEEHAAKITAAHWEALKRAISSSADTEEGAEIIVAVSDGRIIGSVVYYQPATEAYDGLAGVTSYPEIRMLAVCPDFRKQGVGRALLQFCLQKAKDNGYLHIGLHTGEFMHSAIRLYQSTGFERTPERDFEPGGDGKMVLGFRYHLD